MCKYRWVVQSVAPTQLALKWKPVRGATATFTVQCIVMGQGGTARNGSIMHYEPESAEDKRTTFVARGSLVSLKLGQTQFNTNSTLGAGGGGEVTDFHTHTHTHTHTLLVSANLDKIGPWTLGNTYTCG